MKTFISTGIAVLLAFALKAQNNDYQLTVKLPAQKTPAMVYLIENYGWSNNKTIDSAKLVNGTASFNGMVTEPLKAYILLNHSGKDADKWKPDNDALMVYLEPAAMVVSGQDSVKTAKIAGSALNDAYVQYYNAVLSNGNKILAQINADYLAKPANQRGDKAFQAGLMARVSQVTKRTDSLKLVYIKQHPDSQLSLFALQELAGAGVDITKLTPVYKQLNPLLKSSSTGKKLALILDEYGPTSIGALAPDFTQNDVSDKPVKLSDFRGKYVLLDFWASWCGPCRAENPNVVKQYNRFKNKNFTVLGVSLDQPGKKAAWLAAIKSDGLSWTQVSDLQFWNNAVARAYNIRSVPQNFLIDPAGKIIAKNLRGDALGEKLEAILK